MPDKSMSDLTSLKAARGYTKASITRLHNFVSNENDVAADSLFTLQTKKDRLVEVFKEYEEANKAILAIEPADKEDVDSVEGKYYYIMTALNKYIQEKTANDCTEHSKKVKLPTIDIGKFSGNYSEYLPFKSLFDSLIHNDKSLDQLQKLYYLRSLLVGEPFELIKNLPLIGSSYKDAICLIEKRYNNRYKIINNHVCTLLDLPPIFKANHINLRKFVSSVRQTLAALQNLNLSVSSWDPLIIAILTRKLDAYTARAFQLERQEEDEPRVDHLLDYLDKRALALENAEPATKVNKVSVNMAATEGKPTCIYCESCDHKLFNCNSFKLLPSLERLKFAKSKNLCKICLNKHVGKCKYHFKCDQCKQRHNTLVHYDEPAPVSLLSGNLSNKFVLLPTAKVKIFTRDSQIIYAKAILDSGSQVSLATSDLIQRLGLSPTLTSTNIIGVGNKNNNIRYCIPLNIHSTISPFELTINCNVVDKITCKLPQTKIDLNKLQLPKNIVLADDQFYLPSNIDLLMGADIFFQVLLPQQALPEPQGYTPSIINTQFGNVLGGTVLNSKFVNSKVTLFCIKCETEIQDTLKSFWETEKVPQLFCEKIPEQQLAEKIFQNSLKITANKFQVDLPLKIPINDVNSNLGNSFNLALNRFHNLEKKLHNNSNLLTEYCKFIDEYVELGHGQYVDINLYNLGRDPVYFLPHHAVVNESSKTTRTRVVFDGSMKTNKKVSLNDIMLNGPTVQKELFDILLLFRFGDYTFSTDIRRMFRNILINPEFTSLQNILWRASPNEHIKCIRLNTITYGLTSSSFLATRCLIELANLYKEQYPLAAFILKNYTYVDDILYSSSDLNKLLEAKSQLIKLLSLRSFETHKWSSNSATQILADIPTSKHYFNEVELKNESYHVKALGLNLNVKNDCFIINSPQLSDNKVLTKRSILSYIAKFYDPLGFISPVIVTAKLFMQKLWSEGIGWNDSPSECFKNQWSQFVDGLAAMGVIDIPRNICIPSSTKAVQLIGFSDASLSGIGCCLYLRVVDSAGKVQSSLLCAKSKINSLAKSLTVPRLELNAALLLATLANRLHTLLKLKLEINDVYLYTDSMIVLGWLNIEIINLQAYVANRVRIIKQNTTNFHWNYVMSKDNPADLVSRGIEPRELPLNSLWWQGPAYLQDSEYKFDNKISVPLDLPEIKAGSAFPSEVSLVCAKKNNVYHFLEKYSDLNKMTRVLGYMLRFINNIKYKNKNKSNFLSTKELQQALQLIIKNEQLYYYQKEYHALESRKNVEGPLKPLHPFVDKIGLLRVGGRLQNSNLSFSRRHPIILPKLSRITELIIRHEHIRLLHAGPKLLLSALNQRYWLLNGMRQVRKVTHKCLTCFRFKAEVAKQLMGSLPQQRITPCKPFLKVGVDFAGPIKVKNSRIRRAVESKGYICVFICFVTKAIHLELASDISTDTFLACFKRFIARRGLPSEVFTDNGGCFRGAASQLVDLYKHFNSKDHQTRVQAYAVQQAIKFHFTPSYSPVFAGLAEAAVKSTKFHLKRILQNLILTYEQLNTVLVQIEGILNSRPITQLTSDINDFSYLTPGHFLTGDAIMAYPEKDLTDLPSNRLSFWKLCEHLRQCFWNIWHKYYLNTLQHRPKWQHDVPNVTEGMLVILKEPNTPPMQWPMARVSQVNPGKDGKVRALQVTTPNGKTYSRSLSSICILPINDQAI